jgi:alcohol-forming fatty acyl-CoA reductase
VETLRKITVIDGDCSEVNLGMSDETRARLCEKLTMIFHFAATTRFDEKLKTANLRGTLEMLKLARECKSIKLFCHISTAYCHLDVSNLIEKSYPPSVNPHELMSIVDRLTENEAELIKSKYLNEFIPNTYVLTKSLAEAIVVEALEIHKLPVMIVRPSIITPTLSDPQAGWVNDYNGLGGLLIAIGKGVLRSVYCNEEYHGDFIPVDIAIHGIMMCTWNYLSLR